MRTDIVRRNTILIISLLWLCISCSYTDDSKVSGEKSVGLRECEIAPVIEKILDDEFLPGMIKSGEQPDEYFITICCFPNDTLQALFLDSNQIAESYIYIDEDFLWFERGGYQFVVEDAFKEYFHKTPSIHDFDYYYKFYDRDNLPYIIDEETVEAGYGLVNNTYRELYFRFFQG